MNRRFSFLTSLCPATTINDNQVSQTAYTKTYGTSYMRSNLPDTSFIGSSLNEIYQYNTWDNRIYKQLSDNTVKTYYLRDMSGKAVAEYDFVSSTWKYDIYGKERIGTFGPHFEFSINDHLGTERVAYTAKTLACSPLSIEYTIDNTNDFYPFGKALRTYSNLNMSEYGYQGSEREKELSKNDYYTHFRGLDVEVARWKQVDPKWIELENPYMSMKSNPVLLNDQKGDTPPDPPQFTPKTLVRAATAKSVQVHTEKANKAASEMVNVTVGAGVSVGISATAGNYFSAGANATLIKATVSTNLNNNQSLSVTGPGIGYSMAAGYGQAKVSVSNSMNVGGVGIQYKSKEGTSVYLIAPKGSVGLYGVYGMSSYGTSLTDGTSAGQFVQSTKYSLSVDAGPVNASVSVDPKAANTFGSETWEEMKGFFKNIFSSETINQFGTDPNHTSKQYAKGQ